MFLSKLKNFVKLYSIFFDKPFVIAFNSFTWGLANNIAGILFASFCILFFETSLQTYKQALIIKIKGFQSYNFGLALGRIIVTSYKIPKINLNHEIGHFRQSLILGSLYFLLIGIPSLVRAIIFIYNPRFNYYYFYSEAWADELGGVYKLRNHKLNKWWKYLSLKSIL